MKAHTNPERLHASERVGFEQRVVDAATAPRIKTTGVNSAFAMGGAIQSAEFEPGQSGLGRMVQVFLHTDVEKRIAEHNEGAIDMDSVTGLSFVVNHFLSSGLDQADRDRDRLSAELF